MARRLMSQVSSRRMRHAVKTWPPHFQAVKGGRKRCEIRRDDRGYQVGDDLELQEWDPQTCHYTGHALSARISHVDRVGDSSDLRLGVFLDHSIVVLSLADVQPTPLTLGDG